jgi:hypothetical protein
VWQLLEAHLHMMINNEGYEEYEENEEYEEGCIVADGNNVYFAGKLRRMDIGPTRIIDDTERRTRAKGYKHQ